LMGWWPNDLQRQARVGFIHGSGRACAMRGCPYLYLGRVRMIREAYCSQYGDHAHC